MGLLRKTDSVRYGICRNRRHDLGLDYSHDLYTMRCNVHGRAVLRHAYKVCSDSSSVSTDLPSGGLYYAAAVLAPPGYGPYAAWITGWSNWIGQITAAPSVDYALAAMILAARSIQNPSYIPTHWQTF